jgi:small multidrug resistance pump
LLRSLTSPAPLPPERARLFRWVFAVAAAYNMAFGLWAVLAPSAFFLDFDLAAPTYPAIWSCLGMVVGVYGLGYAYAAWKLDRAWPFIAIGLLGKILGPAGWVLTVAQGEWPVRTLTLLVFNDLIWWVPFALFLLEGTRLSERIRRRAPEVCAAINFAAILAMATILRQGTEVGGSVPARISYITQHPLLWRSGWAVWMAAAISLVGFYAWWASRLELSRLAIAALSIGVIGLVCDLFAESLLLAWLPRELERIATLATLTTGGFANGLYTLAGILLTLATPGLRGVGRAAAWLAWSAGAALTVSTFAHFPTGIAASTAVLFAIFCPWVVWLGWSLRASAPV